MSDESDLSDQADGSDGSGGLGVEVGWGRLVVLMV